MPRFSAEIILFAALTVVPATAAETRKPAPEGHEHAMIILVADGMTVSEHGDGTLIILEGVHPVGTIVSDIGGKRAMDAFAVRELPTHYNACNQLKHELGLWHPDGINSLITWRDGHVSEEFGHVLAEPPLMTNPEAAARERVSLDRAGTARLMLAEMVEPSVTDGRVSLVVEGTPLPPGHYDGIAVMTECFDDLPQHP